MAAARLSSQCAKSLSLLSSSTGVSGSEVIRAGLVGIHRNSIPGAALRLVRAIGSAAWDGSRVRLYNRLKRSSRLSRNRKAPLHSPWALRYRWPNCGPGPCRSGIIRPESVELLSNLVWAAVILALWGVWLADWRRRHETSPLPRAGVQLLALAMLSAILLPAISISDDLQASHNPAEVQRTSDRNDRHAVLAKSPHSLPAALALLAFCLRPSRLHTIAFLTTGVAMPRRQVAYSHTLWSRPPPSA